VSFSSAQVQSIHPGFVWPTVERNTSFNIRGTGFGHRAQHVTSVTVGGLACLGIRWYSSSSIECSVGPTATFKTGNVDVQLGSVSSQGGDRLLSE